MKIKLQIAGLIFIVITIGSCLRVDTGINLRKNGSVSVTLEYVLSAGISDFGRGFGSDEPWFLPLTEKDFVQQTLRHPGVKLKSYKNKISTTGDETIKVELESGSMEEIAAFLYLEMAVKERDGGGSFTLRFPSFPPVPEGNDEIDLFMENAAGNSFFTFSFNPPSKIKTATPGIIEDGNAVIELSLKDIFSEDAPAVWMVSW